MSLKDYKVFPNPLKKESSCELFLKDLETLNPKQPQLENAMNNFQLIDNNKLASAKQVYAVACHFANIQAKNPSERYGLTKVFNAVLNKFYSDQDAKMTHGEVTDFFEHQEVPKQFKTLIKKPKASKKVKTQTVQQAEIALDSKKPKTSKKIAAKNSVAKDLDNRVNALETKVSGMDSKLDAMLKILQAK